MGVVLTLDDGQREPRMSAHVGDPGRVDDASA
jgi:hypothetical protein